jgi:hypothetical protein
MGIIAVALFAIAYIVDVTATSTDKYFTPTGLMLLGLTALALHLLGVGTEWRLPSRRRGFRR